MIKTEAKYTGVARNETNKWRGERINGAGAIYGTLFIKQIGTLIYDGVGWAKVKPESIAKLAGYDAEGNEVYRS